MIKIRIYFDPQQGVLSPFEAEEKGLVRYLDSGETEDGIPYEDYELVMDQTVEFTLPVPGLDLRDDSGVTICQYNSDLILCIDGIEVGFKSPEYHEIWSFGGILRSLPPEADHFPDVILPDGRIVPYPPNARKYV